MRRILAAASMLLMLSLTLGGCKNGETVSPGEATQDLAGFSIEGSASGGGTVRNANLSLLEMRDENGDTVVTLDFVSDSTLSRARRGMSSTRPSTRSIRWASPSGS